MGLMNYLLRDRHGTHYFRRAIPAELRPVMPAPWAGKANWKASLQTEDPATAKRAHALDNNAAERALRSGARTTCSPDPSWVPSARRRSPR